MASGATYRCTDCGQVATFSAHGLAYRHASGQVEVLRHPGETRTLERLGTTAAKAIRNFQLLRCDDLMCRGCGAVFEDRRLIEPSNVVSFGVYAIVVLVVLALPIAIWTWPGVLPTETPAILTGPNRVWIAFVVAMMLVLALAALDGKLAKWKYGKLKPPESPACCPQCRGTDLANVHDFKNANAPPACPACGRQSLAHEGDWIS